MINFLVSSLTPKKNTIRRFRFLKSDNRFLTFDNFHWMQVSRQSSIDTEDLLRVPNHTLQIARQHHFAIAFREDRPQNATVFFQLLEFVLDFHNIDG